MPVVRLDKVSLSFGLNPLLDNVSLQLRKRERVCLLGRNGEGKSSLLNRRSNSHMSILFYMHYKDSFESRIYYLNHLT